MRQPTTMHHTLRQTLHFISHHVLFTLCFLVLMSSVVELISNHTWHHFMDPNFWRQALIIFVGLLISINLITKKVAQHVDGNVVPPLAWITISWRLPLYLLALIFWLVMLYYLVSYVLMYLFYLLIALFGDSALVEDMFLLTWYSMLFYCFARFCLVLPNAALGQTYSFTSAWFDSRENHIQLTLILAAAPAVCYWLTVQFFYSDHLTSIWIRNLLISLTLMFILTVLSYLGLDSKRNH